MEVPTLYKAYVRGYTPKISPYMLQYHHFKILEFPLMWGKSGCMIEGSLEVKFPTIWTVGKAEVGRVRE